MHCAIIIRLKFNLIWNYTQTLPHKSNYGVLKITFFAHHRKGFEKQGCASPEFRGNIKCSKNEAMKNYNLFFLKHNLWNVIKLIDWMDAEAVVHTDIAKYASKNRRWKWRKQKSLMPENLLLLKLQNSLSFCWAAEENHKNIVRMQFSVRNRNLLRCLGLQLDIPWSYRTKFMIFSFSRSM